MTISNEKFTPAPKPATPDALRCDRRNRQDRIGTTRRTPPRRPSTMQAALHAERGLVDIAAYLKSDRMLWLFWLAIDNACTPSCC